MDFDYVITALILASALFSGVAAVRNRAKRWLVVLAVNLVALGGSWLFLRGYVSYVAGPVWFLSMLLPSLAIQLADRLSRRERFAAASWISRIAAVLHPSPLTQQRVLVAEAQRLEQAGEIDASKRVLERLAMQPGARLLATLLGLRLDQRWDEIRALLEEDAARAAFNATAFSFWLRALGETGAREELIAAYAAGAKSMHNAPVEAQVLLFAAAFGGREEATANILAAQHSDMPEDGQTLWRLTAARCHRDVGAELEALAKRARPRVAMMARARRTTEIPAPLSAQAEAALDGLEREAAALEPTRAPQPTATIALALFNAYVFFREVPGGSTDLANLHRLGALDTSEMENWWRLATAATLHYGFAHVAMNVIALLALGPALEASVGRARMLAIYILSGIAANALALRWTGAGYSKPALLVGASGAVMGIAGALLVRRAIRWRTRRSLAARSETVRLGAVFVIQFVSDELIPNVAGSVHIFGAILGAAVALGLPRSNASPARLMARNGWILLGAFLALGVGGLELAWRVPQPYFSTDECSESNDLGACRVDCEAMFGPLDAPVLSPPKISGRQREQLLRSCNHHAYAMSQQNRFREAFRVYEASCKAGNMLGCTNEGVLLEEPGMGSTDPQRAAELYRKACDAGQKEACDNLQHLTLP